MSFWDLAVFFFWAFVFVAYLMALISIFGDLFRDPALGGGAKALWTLFLVFVPFLTALIYLIARGRGMNERSAARERRWEQDAVERIRGASASSPTNEVEQAKSLLDSGAITQAEFETLKSKALGASTTTTPAPSAPTA